MPKTIFEVVAVGSPDITALTQNEQDIMLATLYQRILNFAKENKDNSESIESK